MLWLISCVFNPNTDSARDTLRPAHREYLSKQPSVLVLAGPTQSDDGETITGSVFLLNASSRAAAQSFSDAEPYTHGGLYKSVTIQRMRKGQWNPDSAKDA